MENKDLNHKKIYGYMKIAISEAKKAFKKDEVPIGAIIVAPDGTILSRAHNLVENKHNATAHAEILAITKATKKMGEKYLMGCSIFITLEPCPMCAMAISLAKIENVYFASEDKKGGAIINGINLYNNAKNIYKPNVLGGIMSEDSTKLLKDFFKNLRSFNKKLEKNQKRSRI